MQRILLGLVLLATLNSCSLVTDRGAPEPTSLKPNGKARSMDLGNFSVSLAVKDLAASRKFYETLGFSSVGGEPQQNWLILKNGDATIGLFQGMFEQNILTFNPGWARDGKHPEKFTDVRELQKQLKAAGLKLMSEADEASKGPASLTLMDPDGNPILIDQHR